MVSQPDVAMPELREMLPGSDYVDFIIRLLAQCPGRVIKSRMSKKIPSGSMAVQSRRLSGRVRPTAYLRATIFSPAPYPNLIATG